MGFRVDPLNKSGKLDVEFFASHSYIEASTLLVNYLVEEGFEEKNEQFSIEFFGRMWQVFPEKKWL